MRRPPTSARGSWPSGTGCGRSAKCRASNRPAAERALRHGVILRKVNGGTKSEESNRFIERILSARETCRLQGRSMLDDLAAAVTAARLGEPVPSLLPP